MGAKALEFSIIDPPLLIIFIKKINKIQKKFKKNYHFLKNVTKKIIILHTVWRFG